MCGSSLSFFFFFVLFPQDGRLWAITQSHQVGKLTTAGFRNLGFIGHEDLTDFAFDPKDNSMWAVNRIVSLPREMHRGLALPLLPYHRHHHHLVFFSFFSFLPCSSVVLRRSSPSGLHLDRVQACMLLCIQFSLCMCTSSCSYTARTRRRRVEAEGTNECLSPTPLVSISESTVEFLL